MIEWCQIDQNTFHGYLSKEKSFISYKITIRLVNNMWMLLSDKLHLYKTLSNDIEESKGLAIQEVKQKLTSLVQSHSDALSILKNLN
jgi:hypothetical protein